MKALIFSTLPEISERDKREAQAILAIKQRYGKNAILRAYNLEKYSTAAERNEQIGGHRA